MEREKQKRIALLLWAGTVLLIACTTLRFLLPSEGQDSSVTALPASAAEEADTPVVDLNTATAEELELLPGIGPTLAERIVVWREENGPFDQPEDVMAVSGIGQATYEKIAPYIN